MSSEVFSIWWLSAFGGPKGPYGGPKGPYGGPKGPYGGPKGPYHSHVRIPKDMGPMVWVPLTIFRGPIVGGP